MKIAEEETKKTKSNTEKEIKDVKENKKSEDKKATEPVKKHKRFEIRYVPMEDKKSTEDNDSDTYYEARTAKRIRTKITRIGNIPENLGGRENEWEQSET